MISKEVNKLIKKANNNNSAIHTMQIINNLKVQ